MEEKRDLTAFLSEYGPDNPEPRQMKDSAQPSRDSEAEQQSLQDYIKGLDP